MNDIQTGNAIRPSLIIFDCDGVLVDSEVLAARALQEVLRRGGVAVELEAIERCTGMKQADIIATLEAGIGAPIDPALVGSVWPATRALFAAELTSTPGLPAFLDRWDGPRCVASSSSHERIRFSLSVTGLTRHFDDAAIFSASDVARGKPAPDLFLHAAARMGADPADCLVIEDSRFGVAGAVAGGFMAGGYVGGAHARAQTAMALRDAGASWVEESWATIARRIGMA